MFDRDCAGLRRWTAAVDEPALRVQVELRGLIRGDDRADCHAADQAAAMRAKAREWRHRRNQRHAVPDRSARTAGHHVDAPAAAKHHRGAQETPRLRLPLPQTTRRPFSVGNEKRTRHRAICGVMGPNRLRMCRRRARSCRTTARKIRPRCRLDVSVTNK